MVWRGFFLSLPPGHLPGGKVTSVNGRVQFCNFMLGSCRIMLESSAIEHDASTVFSKFLLDVGLQFCVAGAVFAEIGG